MRLDDRTVFPSGMEEYLSYYGWHFSKKMCQWAVSKMFKEGESGEKEKITPYTKETLEIISKRFDVDVKIDYDAVYIANMCKADFLGSSVPDEKHLIMYIKDVTEDPDGYDGMPFTRFYADCIGSGTPIYWEDML